MQDCLVGEGGYFVSEEDVRAAQGKVLLEHAETEKLLNLRKIEAKRFSKALGAIAEVLERNPSQLFFTGELTLLKYGQVEQMDDKALDAIQLKQLVREIRDLESKLKELAEKKNSIGF